ncbi:hypothetical protein LPJ64_005351 [Coemansia asiatica]|uniref:Uncharacterized protein n=1 Tax=Coemansia asiatica TaxID=1052880 RepID=A0A9W7XGM1_9FUNG|nr:hypothetical protein LPJ64_005351 [Coemansia asiatica]KAJ2861279.1 hypothetical protein FB639_005521 [Coemansia asiatica]
MSSRVPTAFRPLETTSSFAAVEAPVPRRTATTLPASYDSDSSYDSYAQERLQLLSRLEQRWYPVRASSCSPRSSDCVAPVPRRSYAPSFSSSRPSSSSSSGAALEPLVAEDAACMELRGILCLDKHPHATSRASSASSSFCGSQPGDHNLNGLQQLEEIVIYANSPPARSNNPMPMDSGFGSSAY